MQIHPAPAAIHASSVAGAIDELERASRHAFISSIFALLVCGTCWGAFGAGLGGGILGIVALSLARSLNSQLSDGIFCQKCCCLCPSRWESFSKAWHMRNVFATISILTPVFAIAPAAAGSVLVAASNEEGYGSPSEMNAKLCPHDCVTQPITKVECTECALDDWGYLQLHDAESLSCQSMEAHAPCWRMLETCDAGANGTISCGDYLSWTSWPSVDEHKTKACKDHCDCIGGVIHSACRMVAFVGWVGILNAICMIGFMLTSCITSCTLNSFLKIAGKGVVIGQPVQVSFSEIVAVGGTGQTIVLGRQTTPENDGSAPVQVPFLETVTVGGTGQTILPGRQLTPENDGAA